MMVDAEKDFIFSAIVWRFILSTCLIIKECMQHMDFESKKKKSPQNKTLTLKIRQSCYFKI